MAIYTSYYGNHNHFPKDSYLVSVSLTSPKGMCDKDLFSLSPDINTLEAYKKNIIDEDQYTSTYYNKLSAIKPEVKQKLIDFLHTQEATHPGGVFLLCYERPEQFCHRHLLAKWLDIGIKEYPIFKQGK